jgi:hypothetical protein
MPSPVASNRARPRHIAIGCGVIVAAAMWRAASAQFSNGMLDLVVFAPPAAALGLTATWGAHVFAPRRFTWQRGLLGVLVGGVGVSPLIAALVAFSAAWDPASFQFVFNVGAWVALAGGLTTGTVNWALYRLRQAWRARHAHSSQPTSARLPT